MLISILRMGKWRPRHDSPEGLSGGHGTESEAWTWDLVLFLLSYSEGSLREPQEAEENSRNSQDAWEPGCLDPLALTAPRLRCDPVELSPCLCLCCKKVVSRGRTLDCLDQGPLSQAPSLCPPPCVPLPQAHFCVLSLSPTSGSPSPRPHPWVTSPRPCACVPLPPLLS